MSCTDNKDGSCSVEYVPYEPGTYNLNVTYGGQPIKGTQLLQLGKNPFTTMIQLYLKQIKVSFHEQT